MANEIFRNAREELQDADIAVDFGVHLQLLEVGLHDTFLIIFDMNAHVGEAGIVGRDESIEVLGVELGGTVAAQQLVLEEDAHLGDEWGVVVLGGGNLDGGEEVLTTVATYHAHRQLRAGQHDRLVQVFEHETQG